MIRKESRDVKEVLDQDHEEPESLGRTNDLIADFLEWSGSW
jgi:hypothetical protein